MWEMSYIYNNKIIEVVLDQLLYDWYFQTSLYKQYNLQYKK